MFTNNLKLTWRSLLRKKSFSIINISGLAVGMAVCLLILVYVRFETSYDTFHRNAENIYRTKIYAYRNGELHAKVAYTYRDMGETMKNEIPEVDEFCRYHPNWGGAVVSFENERGVHQEFLEDNMAFADSTFLTMFSFPLLYGDRNALSKPNSIVLTRESLRKYYGDVSINPIGKILEIQGGWAPGSYTVSGVIDVPQNSHLHPEFLLSFYNLLQNRQYQEDEGWGWSNFYTYVTLNPRSDRDGLQEKFDQVIDLHLGEDLEGRGAKEEIYLEPLTDIHLYSEIEEDDTDKSSARTVYLFAAIALFILVIAWVNYINLSTAKAMERAKEVGIKKSIGAYRGQLIVQFLTEAFLINLVAFIISLSLAYLAQPALNQLMEKQLPVSILFSPEFIFISLAVVFIGSLLSGLYPAFILSSFRPATVLKGSFSLQGKGSLLRKSLVVFQFVCSFFLIAGTFAVIKQVDFMREQKLGLNLNQVLVVKGPSNIERETFRGTFNSFKTEVKRMPEVKFASSSANIPGGGYDLGTTVRRMGADPTDSKSCNATWVDSEFIDTYELKLISGKDFSEASPEGPNGVIINETAIREFGLGDPQEALSHKLIIGRDTIIIRGVMEDYNWSGLQSEPPPVLLVYTRGSSSYYSFKVQTANIQETVASIEKLYKEMYPGNPYDYFFAEEFYNRQYKSEVQFAKIFGIFSSLAIMVACLGLLGLASYTATLRQKEVGIRKVLGADVSTIVYLFSGYFLKLMITATLIGFPLVYFGISNWLENFAYKISIGWEFFVLPSMALILLGFLAISFQTVKTALVNPSRTLRSE